MNWEHALWYLAGLITVPALYVLGAFLSLYLDHHREARAAAEKEGE